MRSSKSPPRRMLGELGASARIMLLVVVTANCSACTDAATRLAGDMVTGASELRRSGQSELAVVHQPRRSPEGCASSFEVVLRESLHHPEPLGLLLVGCVGSPNYQLLGYDYFTTYHLNAVRVPSELRVEKAPGEAVTITLRRQGEFVDVLGLK